MADLATYIGIFMRTITANAALARGVRVTLNSSGTCDVQDNTAVGDYVTVESIEAAKPGVAANAHGGGKVPALAAATVAVGDPAYTAASGQFTNTSTGNVLVGRWVIGAASGQLGEVELGV